MIEIVNQDAYKHIKTLPDKSVDLIITDPPYSMNGSDTRTKEQRTDRQIKNNNWAKVYSNQNLVNGFDIAFMFSEFKRIQPFINLYIFANKNLLGQILAYCESEGIRNYDILVYHKTNPAPAFRYHYLNDLEYIFYLCDNRVAGLNNDFEYSSKVYQGFVNYTRYTNHPTEKPLALIEKLMRNSSKEGDLVYDPFSGGGTTAHCAKMLNRRFIGSELDAEFYQESLKRLKSQVNGVLF